MRNLPNIVRDRLKATLPVATHPDADLLTAFAERSLSQPERSSILDHLSRCGDCREIVALALPELDTAPVAVRPPASGWLAWPVLRWSFVAAGIVAIASVGIVELHRHDRQTSMAKVTPAKTEVKEAENRPEPAPSTSPSADTSDKVQAPEAKRSLDRLTTGDEQRTPVAAPTGRVVSHGPSMPSQFQQQNTNNMRAQNLSPQIPPPYAKRLPSTSAAAGQISSTQSGETQVQQMDATIAANAPPAQPNMGYADNKVDRAKPAENVAAPATAPAPNNAEASSPGEGPPSSLQLNGRNFSQLMPLSDVRWSINSTGGLQRSLDQGQTWQVVSLNTSSAADPGASLEISAQPSRSKAAKKDRAMKQPASAPVFRAVAANGADVWAGGNSGLLYHSGDSGAHWTRVTPVSSGAVLTGDVVSLDFSDPQHGRVSTSTSELWTTADSGQTWQKQ